MAISIYERLRSIQKDIKVIETYLREYADDPTAIKSLDEMVHDIQIDFERCIKRNDIVEVMKNNPELNLMQRQIYVKGERKRVITYRNRYTVNY